MQIMSRFFLSESRTLSNTSGVIGNTPRVFKISFGVITQAGIGL